MSCVVDFLFTNQVQVGEVRGKVLAPMYPLRHSLTLASVLAEEITNSMRNCGVTQIKDLKPEMVGPAGPWIGQNRPVWKSTP